jgi:hypothetical protein
MTVTSDPFERAAKREEKEEIRREVKRANVMRRMQRRSRSTVAAFGIPYVVWALVEASYYDFGEPTIPQSIIRFFFHGGWFFTSYTFWMLFLIWTWAIGEDVVVNVSKD